MSDFCAIRRLFLLSLAGLCCASACGREGDGRGNLEQVPPSRGEIRLSERLSIGVEMGPAEYMFGRVTGVALTGNRLLAIDSQVPVVRIFDFSGAHLSDVGGPGEGPGEFLRPNGLWANDSGALLVVDASMLRVNTYSSLGGVTDSFHVPPPEAKYFQPWQMAFGAGGARYSSRIVRDQSGNATLEILERTSSEEPTVRERVEVPAVPRDALDEWLYAPRFEWTVAPSGATIYGTTSSGQLAIAGSGGEEVGITLPEPLDVAIPPEEVAWHVARRNAIARQRGGGGISTANVTTSKPRFRVILADSIGRFWVLRDRPSERVDDCDEDPASSNRLLEPRPCWRTRFLADVFSEAGEYLGRADPFLGNDLTATLAMAPPRIAIGEDVLVARTEDSEGTVRLKLFDIVFSDG